MAETQLEISDETKKESIANLFTRTEWGSTLKAIAEGLPGNDVVFTACTMLGFKSRLLHIETNTPGKLVNLYNTDGALIATVSSSSGMPFCSHHKKSMKSKESWCSHQLAIDLVRQMIERSPDIYPEYGQTLSPEKKSGNTASASGMKTPQPPVQSRERQGETTGGGRNENEAQRKARERGEVLVQNAFDTTPSAYHLSIITIYSNVNVGTRKNEIWVSVPAPYMTVDGRIRMAIDAHVNAGGQIEFASEFVRAPGETDDKTLCISKVTSTMLGTSTANAQVNFGGGGSNKSHPYETAETSSYGRALGLLGYGVFGGLASADDVKNAKDDDR